MPGSSSQNWGPCIPKDASLIFTVEADVASGVVLSGDRPQPLDTYAPVEILFTPMTHEYCPHRDTIEWYRHALAHHYGSNRPVQGG